MRSAALVIAGGIAAGCSSDATRFQDGLDGILTSSTPNQRAIIRSPEYQPFPGDAATRKSAPATPAIEPAPVARAELAPVSPAPQSPASAGPVAAAVKPPALDKMATGSTPPDVASGTAPIRAAADADPRGWSRTGGTEITVREGETVYNLSRRYGVPVDAILRANNLSSPQSLSAGRRIVIPTYVYSRSAKVSAPDANAGVAAAKSSRGTVASAPAEQAPVPRQMPQNDVAVLPQNPKQRETAPGEGQAREQAGAMAASKTGAIHVVQPGDSLQKIARHTGASVEAIKQANGLQSGLIRIGQKLVIPRESEQTAAATPAEVDPVVTGASGPAQTSEKSAALADKIGTTVQEAAVQPPESTGIGRMRWPVRGRIISSFRDQVGGSVNDGIDIAVPEGTSIKAAENGIVIYAGDGLKDFGNTVLIRHDDGLVTVYGHASEILVSRGDTVRRGQEIARSGMTGRAEMPKLHFEVRENSTPVNPISYLE
jgi:murein DD-endopeptidase MepM/ murein hydrolase activator NlpD